MSPTNSTTLCVNIHVQVQPPEWRTLSSTMLRIDRDQIVVGSHVQSCAERPKRSSNTYSVLVIAFSSSSVSLSVMDRYSDSIATPISMRSHGVFEYSMGAVICGIRAGGGTISRTGICSSMLEIPLPQRRSIPRWTAAAALRWAAQQGKFRSANLHAVFDREAKSLKPMYICQARSWKVPSSFHATIGHDLLEAIVCRGCFRTAMKANPDLSE